MSTKLTDIDDIDSSYYSDSDNDSYEKEDKKVNKNKIVDVENGDDSDVVDDDDEDEDIADIDMNDIVIPDETEEIDIDEISDTEDDNSQHGGVNKTTNINIPLDNDIDIEDDDDDDDDETENYLQKFKKELTNNYVSEYHPQCLQHNYEEIQLMSKVLRDSDNIIIDPFHKTLPFLTKYEKARILGQRSKQIECGAQPLVKVPENIIDSYLIAELELSQKKIPFILKRPLPNGSFEYWNVKDLELIVF